MLKCPSVIVLAPTEGGGEPDLSETIPVREYRDPPISQDQAWASGTPQTGSGAPSYRNVRDSFPLLVRSVRTSFAEVNVRLEQIAATLGASPLKIFFVVTVPLAYKGIVAGALLAFSRALGEFGATILLAGNIPGETQTLSLAIYNFVQLGRDPEAFTLLGVTVALAFLFVWSSEWLLRSGKES